MVDAAQQEGRFTLRDPLRPSDGGLPCNFSAAPSNRLGCKGHISWAVRDRIPEDRWDCQIPA